ncbi:Suppressor of Ty 6-like protein [Meloidogyne graminicola]|uniref:Suppressor of Ty 6-like protein n=1 Tax=Meloidogyne graminicola TaxID=189291 RepID=A0A8S9ZSD5_9BILA|nr:Suppressor of Ty 6-like protein [Meloidogyne graminicola]
MTAVVRDIMSFKYYLASFSSETIQMIDNVLRTQKKTAPQRIPYCITASKKYPGKFVISYLAQSKIRNEYMGITSEGIRFRKQIFGSTEECINWFKANFAQRPA